MGREDAVLACECAEGGRWEGDGRDEYAHGPLPRTREETRRFRIVLMAAGVFYTLIYPNIP